LSDFSEDFVGFLHILTICGSKTLSLQHTVLHGLTSTGGRSVPESLPLRSTFNVAVKRRHLPSDAGSSSSELPLARMKVEGAKPSFVFEAATERAFFKAASDQAFPTHFTLARTGLRGGLPEELVAHVRRRASSNGRFARGRRRCRTPRSGAGTLSCLLAPFMPALGTSIEGRGPRPTSRAAPRVGFRQQ
jgi:hypothetical protein